MDQIMSRISLYHNLYFVCLGATILFFIISTFLLLYLDVKNCIRFLTGRQAHKEIERLNIEGVAKKTTSKKEVYETMLLQEDKEFFIEREIIMIHTKEIIE